MKRIIRYRNRVAALQQARDRAINNQEQTWRLELRFSANPFWRWLQQKIYLPLIGIQRNHNAAILQSMYALSEQIDHLTQLALDLEQRVQALEQQSIRGVPRVYNAEEPVVIATTQLHQQIRDVADQVMTLETTTHQILAHIAGVPPLVPPQKGQ